MHSVCTFIAADFFDAFISDKHEKDFESNEHGADVPAPDGDGSKDQPHRTGGAASAGVGSGGARESRSLPMAAGHSPTPFG